MTKVSVLMQSVPKKFAEGVNVCEAHRQTKNYKDYLKSIANHILIEALFGVICSKCGHRCEHRSYELDHTHRDGSKNPKLASKTFYQLKMSDVVAEVPKVQIICRFCHALKTHSESGNLARYTQQHRDRIDAYYNEKLRINCQWPLGCQFKKDIVNPKQLWWDHKTPEDPKTPKQFNICEYVFHQTDSTFDPVVLEHEKSNCGILCLLHESFRTRLQVLGYNIWTQGVPESIDSKLEELKLAKKNKLHKIFDTDLVEQDFKKKRAVQEVSSKIPALIKTYQEKRGLKIQKQK